MVIMSNSSSPPDSGTLSNAAPTAATGGGRPPTEVDSHQIRPLTRSTQIFKIPDGGDPVLQRFILEKISFHVALFPHLFLPDQETH